MSSTEFFHFQAPCPVSVAQPFVSDDQHGKSLPELFAVNGVVMLLFDIVFLLLQYFTGDREAAKLPFRIEHSSSI